MLPTEISESLSGHFTGPGQAPFKVLAATPLGGGSINQVFRLRTDAGEFCLKYNHATAYPGMFEAEAQGLTLLAAANAVRVPGVITTGDAGPYAFILLEYLAPGSPARDTMARLGESLADLHRHHVSKFGLDHSNYMGSLPQDNTPADEWAVFFRERRLEPQIRLAHRRGLLPSKALQNFESLYKKLPGFFPEEPPALVHGDLWSGNYHVTSGGEAALIDPAVYYGHREIDIAMSLLFGGFSREFYESYSASFPLAPGWQERTGISNLYPLLIHLNLFGTSYLGDILRIVDRF